MNVRSSACHRISFIGKSEYDIGIIRFLLHVYNLPVADLLFDIEDGVICRIENKIELPFKVEIEPEDIKILNKECRRHLYDLYNRTYHEGDNVEVVGGPDNKAKIFSGPITKNSKTYYVISFKQRIIDVPVEEILIDL